jgi:FkbM family methyltransferase
MAIRTIKNWPTLISDHFKLIKDDYVMYKLRNGITYKIRAGTFDLAFLLEICANNTYMPLGFEINENDTVLDIGAQIGLFSIFASKFAKNGKVYSFEPVPDNALLFNENLKLNGVKNVMLSESAVSGKSGPRDIFLSNDNNLGTHSFFTLNSHVSATDKLKVNTISLKDIVEQNGIKRIDFLKLDCEGAEFEILFGCPDNVLDTIQKISMEYHSLDNENNVESLRKFLTEKGFKVKTQHFFDTVGMLYAKR